MYEIMLWGFEGGYYIDTVLYISILVFNSSKYKNIEAELLKRLMIYEVFYDTFSHRIFNILYLYFRWFYLNTLYIFTYITSSNFGLYTKYPLYNLLHIIQIS